jgi:hypothetical protein
LWILGEPLLVVEYKADRLVAATSARLYPGRLVAMRVEGSGTTLATVLSCSIRALEGNGPVYQVEIASDLAQVSGEAHPGSITNVRERAIA